MQLLQEPLAKTCLVRLEIVLSPNAGHGRLPALALAEAHLHGSVAKVLYHVCVAPAEIERRYQQPLLELEGTAYYVGGCLNEGTSVFLVLFPVLLAQPDSGWVKQVVNIIKHRGVSVEEFQGETAIGVAQVD